MGEIEEACGRIEHLVESGYLPDSLKRDLELLLQAVKRGSAGDADDGPASIIKRAALIKRARKDKKLSRPELADLVGTTQQTIGKIEKGIIEHSSFSAIADVLGIDRRLLDRPPPNPVKP
jgi:DNA-binding XRE family transcriptional regulator